MTVTPSIDMLIVWDSRRQKEANRPAVITALSCCGPRYGTNVPEYAEYNKYTPIYSLF